MKTGAEHEPRTLLYMAHSLMGPDPATTGPRTLGRMLDLAIQAASGKSNQQLAARVRAEMLSADRDNATRGYFMQMMRTWDSARPAAWTDGTAANSAERRSLIQDRLDLTAEEKRRVAQLIPLADVRNTNIIVAESHEPWYTGARRRQGFYWKSYRQYLKDSGWTYDGHIDLDESSDLVIERLSDALRHECWRTKGLVVGYVQSGKTANFTAVVAKAVDAGYRLIVVLAGTLEVLRAQTQRRIDKELIGKELIAAGATASPTHEYAADKDWDRFVAHSALPSSLGQFDIERLTGFLDDYRSLGRGIGALEFQGCYTDRRFNHPDNLRHSAARIVVMKKNPNRIKALRRDLQRLRHTALNEIPTVIIDDESDQASLNTTKAPPKGELRKRTRTNAEIVDLLKALPRAQYVGYTATPFANVFVNPLDPEDLFPKDFMIGLKRPAGYMGVRDFFDFDEEGRPLSGDEMPPGYESNERAFLRSIRRAVGQNEEDKDSVALPRAIDSFMLSGALKLYRAKAGVPLNTRHHTMLVHRSTTQQEHARDRALLLKIFGRAAYGSARANQRLEELWTTDFRPVSEARAGSLPTPATFNELIPFLEEVTERIRASGSEHGPVRVVNAEPGMAEQAPDFDRENVWSILVGGAKLSRGYTVEGLTVSYFRRRIRTADTLMQTGRWFGFRRGYHDLVRVFLGRDEPDRKGKTFDLLEAFKAICMDEEVFRSQLRRYTQQSPGEPPITPRQIPPLVAQHLLRPTAKNKMYNATIAFMNYGGTWNEQTRLPAAPAKLKSNAEVFRELLEARPWSLKNFGITDPENAAATIHWMGLVAEVEPERMLNVLENLKWAERADGYVQQIEFLKGTGDHDPGIRRWLVIAPQQTEDVAYWQCGVPLKVVQRTRVADAGNSGRFKVFSELRHREVIQAIARRTNPPGATPDTLSVRGAGTAILVLYPTVEEMPPRPKAMADDRIALGFGLFFPPNDIRRQVVFTVRDPTRPDAIVIRNDL